MQDVQRTADSVSVALEGDREVAISWSRNRLHFHPRVFRLAFEGFGDATADEVGALLPSLFSAALAGLMERDPLLLRVTLDAGAALLPHLRKLGFLGVRGVHVVTFETSNLLDQESGTSADTGSAVHLMSLAEAALLVGDVALIEVWAEAYGRAARLDPATPQALPEAVLRDLFLGEEDLDTHVSVCALAGERLLGVCPVYRSSDPARMELGPVGVGAAELERHRAVSLAMLSAATERAARRGVERLVAEVDADAPDSVYLFADLPGLVSESLVSLMYVPMWRRASAGEASSRDAVG